MRDERPDHTLQGTALVHEAFLRLVDQKDANWQNRAHFYRVAAFLAPEDDRRMRVALFARSIAAQAWAMPFARLDSAILRGRTPGRHGHAQGTGVHHRARTLMATPGAIPMYIGYVFSEGGTVKGQSVRIDAWQWSLAEPLHGQFRPTSRANLTVPPQETLNTYYIEMAGAYHPTAPRPIAVARDVRGRTKIQWGRFSREKRNPP